MLIILAIQAFALELVPSLKKDLPDIVAEISPSVVNISSTTVLALVTPGAEAFFELWGIPKERKKTALGSGFFIDNCLIMTNNHVLPELGGEVVVTLVDKKQTRAKVIGRDQKMDIALLKLVEKTSCRPVRFGDSETVRIAETVVAVGNPFGLQNTVTKGIISAKNRSIGLGPFDNFLQTDASINPGNSGGPLFNSKGEVIGINTAIRSDTGQSSGIGFAIPSNEAKRLVPVLEQYGRVPRPWLGILGERLTPQLQRYYGLFIGAGVLVYTVVQDAPAFMAGIEQGDVLTHIDGNVITEPNDLERALMKFEPQKMVTLRLVRGTRLLNIQVLLAALPRLDRLPAGIL